MKSKEELNEILDTIQRMDDSEIYSLKDAYVLKRTVEDGELCDDGESGLLNEFIQALNTASFLRTTCVPCARNSSVKINMACGMVPQATK